MIWIQVFIYTLPLYLDFKILLFNATFTIVKNYPLQVIDKNISSSVHLQ